MGLNSAERTRILGIARNVVAQARDLLKNAQSQITQVKVKSGGHDLVTEWDVRTENLIREQLTAAMPGVAIMGEEGGGTQQSGAQWVVDPIDGTVNFAHGLPIWCISLAFVEDGVSQVGVVAAPALGLEFFAARDQGAFLGTQKLQVGPVTELSQALLATGFPYDRATTRANFAEWIHFKTKAGACRRLGAAALDLAWISQGALDGYWETELHPWDVAAGSLLVEEAGGQVRGIDGSPFHIHHGHLAAGNPTMVSHLLRELADVGDLVKRVTR